MALADYPEALATYLEQETGAKVIRDVPKFTIEFSLCDRARVAAELGRHNLTLKNHREYQDRDQNGRMCSRLRAEVQRAPEKTGYDIERGLMAAICRKLDQ